MLPLPFLEIGDQLCQNPNPKCALKEESNSFLVLRIVCVCVFYLTISWYEPKNKKVFEFKNNYAYFFASITLSKFLHMMLVKNLQGDLDQQVCKSGNGPI